MCILFFFVHTHTHTHTHTTHTHTDKSMVAEEEGHEKLEDILEEEGVGVASVDGVGLGAEEVAQIASEWYGRLQPGGIILGTNLFNGYFFDMCNGPVLRSQVANGLERWINKTGVPVGYSLEVAFPSWYAVKA
jgi:hypothetical protein